jgi:FkbM family methyltransferase
MSFTYKNQRFTIQDIKNEDFNNFRELSFLKIIDTLLPSCSVSLDIGANIGNHSIFMSKILKCSVIHAFEPIPYLYNKMLFNFENNNIYNVIPHNIALSSKESTLKCISKLPDNHGSYWLWYEDEKALHPFERGYPSHKGCDGSKYTKSIPSKRLDDVMLKYNNIDKVHYIKIDVEGMELEVLNGGMDLIKKHRPLLQIEVCKDNFSKIEFIMKRMNYIRSHRKIFKGENQLWVYV